MKENFMMLEEYKKIVGARLEKNRNKLIEFMRSVSKVTRI